MGKPLIIEEFGKTIATSGVGLGDGESMEWGMKVRDEFFGAIYELVEKSARAEGAARGTNFWAGAGCCSPRHPTHPPSHIQHTRNHHPWSERSFREYTEALGIRPGPGSLVLEWHPMTRRAMSARPYC
jgi:hypothetical protein